MTVPRVPFAYTLIDKRHKGFAEGKRDSFNWHYFYTFQTESGQQASGKIVESSKGIFREGQEVLVRYLRTDPTENVYAHDPMPKSVLYWFFVGLGGFWVYIAAVPIYRDLAYYRTIRALSRQGQIVQGHIIATHSPSANPSGLTVKLEYAFTSPVGVQCQSRESISLMYLTGAPKPGTTVAVWWNQDSVMLI